MKITIKNIEGKELGPLEVKFPIIADGRGTQAAHQAVVAHLAAQRSGTACAKTKAEVAGTGKKPWRQKGTGMARAGSFQSPLWRGGGVVFGPRPRDYSKRISKGTRRLALRKALSERLQAGDVIVLDELTLGAPKTSALLEILGRLGTDELSTLVVLDAPDRKLELAARNLPLVDVTTSDSLHAYEALRCDKVIFTQRSFQKLEMRLSD